MPRKKLTFTLPQDLAVEFLRRVPASLRSQYVATAIADKLREREEQVIRACEAANNSMDIREIERFFNALADESDAVQEQWSRLGGAKFGGVRLDPTPGSESAKNSAMRDHFWQCFQSTTPDCRSYSAVHLASA